MRTGALVSPVTVGRDLELRQLSLDLEQARLGRGQVVAVTGEAGVGKSRLTLDVVHLANRLGMTVLTGRAVESASPVAYRVIGSAVLPSFRRSGPPDDPRLGPYRSALSILVPEWRAAGQLVPGPDSALAVLEAAALLIRVLAGRNGLLLVLEDLQWADAETLAVVDYLADTIGEEPVLCLATVRTDEPASMSALVDRLARSQSASVVALERLPPPAVEQMLRATLATDDLPAGLVEAVGRHAEGLPLAAEEVLADLVAREALVRGDDRWSFVSTGAPLAPAGFARLVASRLTRLGPEAREVLHAASLLGREFDWSLLAAITGLDEGAVLTALGESTNAQLLGAGDDGSMVRFRHALIQSSILASISPPAQAAIARRAAVAVESAPSAQSPERLELAAALRERAGDRQEAAALLLTLGREALVRGALISAEEVLERALQLAGADSQRVIAILESLADVAEQRGRVERAADLARSLVRHLGVQGAPREQLIAARLRLARAAIGGLLFDEARTALDAAEAEATTAAEEVRVEGLRALLAVETGQLGVAQAHAEAALGAAEAVGEPAVACEALYILGRVVRNIGDDPAAALEPLERMVAVAERGGLPQWHIRALLELGLVDRLTTRRTDRLEQVRDLALEKGALSVVAVADLNIAAVLLGLDQERAVELIRTALELSRRFKLPTLSFALSLQSAMESLAGDRPAHDAILEELLVIQQRAPATASAQMHWPLFHGDVEVAGAALDAAWGQAEHVAGTNPAPHRGLWALAMTVLDHNGAVARSRIATEGFGSWENRGYVALAEAVALGRAGRVDEARDRLAQFERDLGDPRRFHWGPHFARMWAAPAAFAGGWGEPTTWLREGRIFFADLGVTNQVRICDRLLRGMGQAVPRRGRGDAIVPAHLRPLGVTSRETDVLLLVADGLANKEIAERLSLSHRTVETHITQLLGKTGARSRVQLGAMARAPQALER